MKERKSMKHVFGLLACIAFLCLPTVAQNVNRNYGVTDQATVSVGRTRPNMDGGFSGGMPHPYHVEARRWSPIPGADLGINTASTLHRFAEAFHLVKAVDVCHDARRTYIQTGVPPQASSYAFSIGCGRKFYEYDGENLVTSAGETAISKAISDTAAQPASANWIALTNTGITPAVADTTLSGEIVSNGLQRAQGTFADTSAAIGAPPTAGSLAIVGTTGAATLDYWVFACTYQGCTAVGTQVQTTTANATLSNANYVTGSFTGKLGASYYVLVRTQSGTPPSGSLTGGAAQSNTGATGAYISCGALVAGTAPTCTFADQSNTTTAFAVPAADQTFVGKYTLTKTFTATGAQSAQAFGILNAASTGTLYYEGTFASASLITNDTLAFTETVYH